MNRKLLCYGHYCYPKRIKHDRSKLVTDKHNHKHYCLKCHKYLKQKRFYRWRLYNYIENKAHVTYPTGIMRRDIKNLRNKRHYTYHGILTTLMYANKNSLKFNFRGQYFLRYVPFVYDQAQRYVYSMANELHVNLNQINNSIKEASVDSRVFNPKKQKHYFNMNKF